MDELDLEALRAAYESARYSNDDHTTIEVVKNGQTLFVPVDPANSHYAEMLAAEVPFSDYAPPPPTANDVRAEASRRIQALFGARDAAHLSVLISNAQREAIKLLRFGEANLDADQKGRVAEMVAGDAAMDAIRAASNALEASDPIPADYADDKHWPALN